MAHILVGYELGGGHGHLYRLLPVVRGLQADGHRVTLFMRNLRENAPLLAGERHAIVPVPDLVSSIPGTPENAPLASYLDIMCVAGFYDPRTLHTGIMTWNTILEQAAPDLILADHSPMLLLAAFRRYPVVQVADGFTLPPAHGAQFPIFRRGGKPLVDPAHVLGVMQEVQRQQGLPQPRFVTEPFRTAGRLLCSLPELDPYATMRRDPVIGPVARLPRPMPVPDGPPQFFAYLDLQHQATWPVLDGLRNSGMSGEIYCRGMNDEVAAALQRPGLTVHREFQPFEEILARASVILHHGSNGTCCAALAAGRPQLFLPTQMESRLMADAVVARGCGHLLTCRENTARTLPQLLDRFAQDRTMANRAVAVSREIEGRGAHRTVEKILDTCRGVLDQSSATAARVSVAP